MFREEEDVARERAIYRLFSFFFSLFFYEDLGLDIEIAERRSPRLLMTFAPLSAPDLADSNV